MVALKYRAEIDGLRALAVVPVILFHAGFDLFSGGFVGVDVFFVISGYLITTILVEDIENKRFSIVNFYERRARRILPALFFVMACCIPFAWMWMLPSQLKDFSQSLIAVSLFVSNVLFWRESGYFAVAAEKAPLLHTWSLAVEEQYYIVFPVFLFLAWRFGKNRVFWMIVVFAAISLGLSEWGWRHYATANFYLAPTRAWELFAGSIAAFIVMKRGVRKNNMLALLGLAAIIFSIFAYDENTPFPSVYALVPVLGVVLLVLYANEETFAAKVLSTKLFVGIGLISYSAYLWHQPMFAFARIRSIAEPSEFLMIALGAVSFILAIFSWRYIERPFRARQKISKNFVFAFGFMVMSVASVIGIIGHIYSKELTFIRYADDAAKTKTYVALEDAKNGSPVFIESNRYNNGECKFSALNLTGHVAEALLQCNEKYGPGILVLGDSHATNLYHSIVRNPENEAVNFIVGVTKNGCHLPTKKTDCQYDEVRRFIEKNTDVFSNVIYERAGSHMILNKFEKRNIRTSKFDQQHFKADGDTIDIITSYLNSLSKSVPVIWFGPRIEPLIGDTELFDATCKNEFVLGEAHKKVFRDLDHYIDVQLKGYDKINYISQNKVYQFNFPDDYGSCEGLLWMDEDHFSALGDLVFGARYNLLKSDVLKKSD